MIHMAPHACFAPHCWGIWAFQAHAQIIIADCRARQSCLASTLWLKGSHIMLLRAGPPHKAWLACTASRRGCVLGKPHVQHIFHGHLGTPWSRAACRGGSTKGKLQLAAAACATPTCSRHCTHRTHCKAAAERGYVVLYTHCHVSTPWWSEIGQKGVPPMKPLKLCVPSLPMRVPCRQRQDLPALCSPRAHAAAGRP